MGQPLIANRTLTQLVNAAMRSKPDESTDTLDRLLAAAASEGVVLSFMLFGLDHFAAAREQPAGQRKSISVLLGILLQQTPDDVYIDCPAPNEFLAVLPGTPLEQVERAAEEIRHRFTAAMREMKSRQPLSMTVSGTAAAFPRDGETRRTLFNQLRNELLRLCEEGGNRVRRSAPPELQPMKINLPAPLLRRLQTLADAQGESLETLLGEAAHQAIR